MGILRREIGAHRVAPPQSGSPLGGAATAGTGTGGDGVVSGVIGGVIGGVMAGSPLLDGRRVGACARRRRDSRATEQGLSWPPRATRAQRCPCPPEAAGDR